MKTIISEGKTYKEALDKGLTILSLSLEEVNVEIIQEGKVSIFTYIPFKLSLTPKNDIQVGQNEEITNLESHQDSYFLLDFRNDGVYIRIIPADGRDNPLDLYNIQKELMNTKLKDLNQENILTLSKGTEGWIKIAPPQEPIGIDSRVSLDKNEDLMELYMTLLPPLGGKELDIDQVKDLLRERGFFYGINEDIIQDYLLNKKYHNKVLIAKGLKPVNGKDGEIIYHFDRLQDNTPKISNDGKVDYFDLGLVTNVKAGDILVTIIPPTDGEKGFNIFGKEVEPVKGKSRSIKAGKNVVLSEDMETITALINGQVVISKDKISVLPIYEVKEDVNPSIGNIDFWGSVLVKGNINTGFTVKAKGNIEVWGTVEGASLIADGDILIKRGIAGKQKGKIIAQGNIVARYIENAEVIAQGDIIVGEAIMHSSIRAGKTIRINGKKGLLVGGLAQATEEITLKTVGSSLATQTELEVGINPLLREKLIELKNNLNKLNLDIDKISKGILLLERTGIENLPKDKQELLIKLYETKKTLEKNELELSQKLQEIEQEIKDMDKGKVNVFNCLYPGVKITIGTATKYFKEEFKHSSFYLDNGSIKSMPFVGKIK